MALRRQVKNVVKNFSDIEVKVRESTSNDPWGPSSSLTSEIADATYNVQAFTEIMTLLWKRINDHGKNWRHVYKSLVVLEYIVKTGSERVAQQCKENIFAVKTLKDFQFIDKDGKDQGVNVREKSKQLVALLKDEERLKAERQRALKAKERFSQSQGGIGNTNYPKNKRHQGATKYPEARGSLDDSNIPTRPEAEYTEKAEDSRSTDGRIDSDIEKVRPSNEAEEELQLQIALAMSREEAEKDERTKNIESKLFNALDSQPQPSRPQNSTLLNLTDPAPLQANNSNDPWMIPPPQASTQPALGDPWGSSPANPPSANPPPVFAPNPVSVSSDPWGSTTTPAPAPVANASADPWGSEPAPTISQPSIDPWGISSSLQSSQPAADPFAPQDTISSMPTLPLQTSSAALQPQSSEMYADPFGNLTTSEPGKTGSSSSFLNNGSHLVDVDNILSAPKETKTAVNPFMTTATNTNPFLQDKPKPKSINELRSDKTTNAFVQPGNENGVLLPTPMQPSQNNNPFL